MFLSPGRGTWAQHRKAQQLSPALGPEKRQEDMEVQSILQYNPSPLPVETEPDICCL
jgi:hypothetical protein